ncbi:MAG: hypothetical protein JXB00_08365, partial [Bacteroidales bacterium]|nr:hypothetical protein [Bacteroidales bacterium]
AEKQRELESKFRTALNAGNNYMAQKSYTNAKSSFEEALTYKPDDITAKNRLAEASNLILQEQAKQTAFQAKKMQYDGFVSNADKFFASKDYSSAKSEYLKAAQVLPDEQYPKQRVQEIDRLATLAEAEKQRELESKFRTALNAGNNYMAQKSYTNAKSSFEEALTYKPDDITAKNRLAEANNLIRQEQGQQAALQAKKSQYDGFISNADKFFASKDYPSAKSEYLKAAQVLPGEQYPKQRIQEIDRLVADEARAKRETEANYQRAITAANNSFNQKSYANAKASYQEALSFKSDDNLAKSRILEIDNILKQQMAEQAALQAKQKQYDDLVARADGLFNQKNYTAAKDQYKSALQVMPEQTHPQQRITEIDRLMAEEQKLLAENQAKENAYKQAITRADGLFSSKQYEQAKTEYNNALSVKPSETYPKTRITEIDRLILQQQQAQTKETNYKNAVAEADRLFAEKKYSESKASYSKALGVMPSEQYPKAQIAKIDNLLAEAEKLRQQELAKQKQYDGLVAQADKLFTANNYPQAKEIYQKALAIKPDEQYPRARIARIDEIYALVAQQQKKQAASTSTPSQNQPATAKKVVPSELKFKNDSERDIYLAGLKREYPDGVTLEVYKEKFKVTSRYVIIRGNEVNELREVYFSNYGGREYSMNGKPITQMYFESQVKPRDGEKFVKFEY